MKISTYTLILSLILVVAKVTHYLSITWFLALLPALLSCAVGMGALLIVVLAVVAGVLTSE